MGREVLSYFAYVTVTCVYVSQPFTVAATRNHPLLNGVAAYVPWLISSSSMHQTPFLPCDHTLVAFLCVLL